MNYKIKRFLLTFSIAFSSGSFLYYLLSFIFKSSPLVREIKHISHFTYQYPLLFVFIFSMVFTFTSTAWLKNFKRKNNLRKSVGILFVIFFTIFISSGLSSAFIEILNFIVYGKKIYIMNLLGSFGLGLTFGSMLFLISMPLSILSIVTGYILLFFIEKKDKRSLINLTEAQNEN